MKVMECHLVALLALSLTLTVASQVPTPQPTPTDEPVRISTEEVHLNVMAQNTFGRFVPTLTKDDLLVVDNGDPQTITSFARTPANVLILLDTGGNLNFVKSAKLTGLIADILIENLAADDNVAVVQYNDSVETVADWTKNRDTLYASIDAKLLSSKRSRFAYALNTSITIFGSRPLDNRHLILVTDGLDSVVDQAEVERSIQNLLAANITIHVISYTALEANAGRKAAKMIKIGKGDTKPRIPPEIFDANVRSLPISEKQKQFLITMNESQGLIIIDLDRTRTKYVKSKVEALLGSEARLQLLADESGGLFQAPEELETMLTFASVIASAVDSQYVITYMPTKPFGDSTESDSRKVVVGTHCNGVRILSRRKVSANRRVIVK